MVIREMRRPKHSLTSKDVERFLKLRDTLRNRYDRIIDLATSIVKEDEQLSWMNYLSPDDIIKLTDEENSDIYEAFIEIREMSQSLKDII